MKKNSLIFFLIILCFKTYSENYGWVNSIQGLNLRPSPDLNGKVVTLIPEAETVQILIVDKSKRAVINGFPDYWMNIKYGNFTGWVFGAYISNVKILSEEEFNSRNESLTGALDAEKSVIRDFFKQKLEGVTRYKYEIENNLPAGVQFFIEIIRFDDKYYEGRGQF
jgi:hypothetical protein